jgi:hypothetical protein
MLELALSEARAAAGTIVTGQLAAPAGTPPVAVDLVRVERSPAGVASYRVASAELHDDGSFALLVPDDVPPEVAGRACSLRYAVRATCGDDDVREALTVIP